MQRRMPVSSRSPDEKSETPVQSSEQTEPNTPTVFARCCQSVLAILPYLLFVHAVTSAILCTLKHIVPDFMLTCAQVLLQSVWAGKTVHLRRWRVELKKRFWAAAVGAIFVISGISCLVMTTTPRSKSNSALIILYLVALFGTLLAAVNYVGTRPGM